VGGEARKAKSLRIGVHNANAVVWGPVRRASTFAALSSASFGRDAFSGENVRDLSALNANHTNTMTF